MVSIGCTTMKMFGLMSNLLKIKGGVTKVDKILNSREEYKVKNYSWWVMKNQILKGKYALLGAKVIVLSLITANMELI